MEEYSSTRWKCIETEREREIVAKFDFCILAILRQMKNYSAKQPPYRKVYRCELSRIKKWWSMPRGKTRHPTIDYVSRWRGWNFYRRRLTTVKRLPRSESIKMKKKKKKRKEKIWRKNRSKDDIFKHVILKGKQVGDWANSKMNKTMSLRDFDATRLPQNIFERATY